ncbi:hypothetical protein GGR92_000995 [Spirosoma lacussanchae]|uniref:sensor histidine kinase n=1 Tax=Spirosoma lacussanchae TaxID=1884249 RepID=UPI001FEB511E|nr:histidine kinase [Spirosoma lacussanchae]
MVRWLLFLGMMLSGRLGVASHLDTIRLSQLDRGPIYLRDRSVLRSTDRQAGWLSVFRQAAGERVSSNLPTNGQQVYWLRLLVLNDADTSRTLYTYAATSQTVVCYRLMPDSGRLIDSLRCGTMVPRQDWATPDDDQYIPLRFGARQTTVVLIRVANRPGLLPALTHSELPRPSLGLRFESEAFHFRQALFQYRRNLPELQYRSWVQGGLLFFLLFVVLIYLYYRRPLYGYYALYVLAGCLYALLKTRTYTPIGQVFATMPLLRYHAMESIVWVGWGAYMYFLVELLDLARTHPAAARQLQQWGRFAIAYSLLAGGLLLLTNDGGLYQLSYWFCRLVFGSVHVAVLVWMLWRVPSVLTRYVVVGNVLLTVIGVLASLRAGEIILVGESLPGYVDNLLMLPLGVLLEIIVFALALAHRIRIIDRERQASQAAYIDEIEQRTAYEKRLAEVEMLALRSQMNPHFLFNSLNTIEYFVLKGDEANATRYLSNFSRLLRLILNHSNEDTVRLTEEISGLQLYLELESSRFDENFQYVIDIDPAIDQDAVVVPPLLLQPFVENAVWHGLQHSHRPDKCVWLRVLMLNEETIQFEIEDNGIGREQSARLKSRSATRQKSLGMAITQQRIDLFNRNYPSQLNVQLIDLADGGRCGTLVRITYQLRLTSPSRPQTSHNQL